MKLTFFLISLLLVSSLFGENGVGIVSENDSHTEKFRVVWSSDPTTEATIGWNQKKGEPGVVHFGTEDLGRKHHLYPETQKVDRSHRYTETINNCFVRLTGLTPNTRYFFCIKDAAGVSRRLSFLTASDEAKPFIFAAGGDSRNFRDVRVHANQICAKLKPLFIAFTGDMISKDTEEEWSEWFDDWQETIDEEGSMIPIVAHRGNHERRLDSIHNYFDTPADAYFDWAIGGDMFRYFALNSEIPANGKQGDWLQKRLRQYRGEVTHLVAGYHKPMRPHVSKKSEGDNPYLWADIFYDCGLDLAIESDSHVMKRTLPLKPHDEGHEDFSVSLNDKNATVYIGEGCWGAPLRAADDGKPWTIATVSFNGFDWIRVTPKSIEVKTVRVGNTASIESIDPQHPYTAPTGLELWNPKGGRVLVIPGDR